MNLNIIPIWFCLLLGAGIPLGATESSPRFLIHLLDYIALDYSGAVADGKIISPSEYQEQLEFAKSSLELVDNIDALKGDAKLKADLVELKGLLEHKAASTVVVAKIRKLEAGIFQSAKLSVSPHSWPDIFKGREIFDKNCTQCHGLTGHGDGPSGGELDPKPANFHNEARMDDISPFQMFNAIRLGVPGTAMAAFADFSDAEVWDLAFYAASLRYGEEKFYGDTSAKIPWTLEELASKSNQRLLENEFLHKTDIARARSYREAKTEAIDYILYTRNQLNQAREKYLRHEYAEAKNQAISAYLDGVEPIEPKLRLKDSAFAISLEEKMAIYRGQIDRRVPISEIDETLAALDQILTQAETLVRKEKSSFAMTFTIAGGIFLREAFEAALILITLLGVTRGLKLKKASFFVHLGWISAVVVGLIAWVFSGWVMGISGMQREVLEGSITFFAVIILLYFGYWLHRKTEIGKWHQFIQEMVKSAVDNKKMLGLGVVSFMGVFREAFETVLFLRALLLESAGQETALSLGVLCAFVFVLIVAYFAIRSSARIPLKQLFGISTVLLVFLAFVLIGKSVHSFQEAGIIPLNFLPIKFNLELLGVYPTYETLIPQLVLLVASFLIWWMGKTRKFGSGMSTQVI